MVTLLNDPILGESIMTYSSNMLIEKAIINAEDGKLESFAEYIEMYWKERKRFQFAYDSKTIGKEKVES